jgi:hypothetical protein
VGKRRGAEDRREGGVREWRYFALGDDEFHDPGHISTDRDRLLASRLWKG